MLKDIIRVDQACAGPFREAVTKSNQVTVSPGPRIPDMANKFGKGRLYFLVPRLPVFVCHHRAVPTIWDNFTIFGTNCVRHTRVHSVRIFADAARGEWVSKFPMAHNSKGLCLCVKFCLSIFVVSCFNLSEVR